MGFGLGPEARKDRYQPNWQEKALIKGGVPQISNATAPFCV